VQPLLNPAQPQSEQRHLIPSDSFFLLPWLFGKAIFSESPWRSQWFCYLLLNDRNNRNFGALETCLSRKRFERSVAVERLERLERIDLGGFVLAGIKPGLILF
jgi:hypothetical protein